MSGNPVQLNHVELEIVNQSPEQAIVAIKYILIVDDQIQDGSSSTETPARGPNIKCKYYLSGS